MFKQHLTDFITFIRTQGVVGLAVGFILGKAVSDLVASLVNDIINPLIGLIFTKFSDLGSLAINIHGSVISYGRFISLLINFVIVAAVVYFLITKLLSKLDKPKA